MNLFLRRHFIRVYFIIHSINESINIKKDELLSPSFNDYNQLFYSFIIFLITISESRLNINK